MIYRHEIVNYFFKNSLIFKNNKELKLSYLLYTDSTYYLKS